MKYIVGPVELTGEVITDAVSQQQSIQGGGGTTGRWEVAITMNKQGAKDFGKVSNRLFGRAGAPEPVRVRPRRQGHLRADYECADP